MVDEIGVTVTLKDRQKFRRDAQDTAKDVKGIGDAGRDIRKHFDSAADSITRFAKRAVLGLGAAGVAGAFLAVRTGLNEFSEAQAGIAQSNAAIASTGGIANVTADHVQKLAHSIQDYSGQQDDAIAGAENLLLTFTNIRNSVGAGNDLFDQATIAAADMAVVFHKDVATSALQLGKALQEPISGVTALRKMGVQLSDQQKAQIKGFVAVGNVLAAQKVIMAEVTRQTAGSAKAFGQTLPGQLARARRSWEDFTEGLVTTVMPVLAPLLTRVLDILQSYAPQISAMVNRAVPAINRFADSFAANLPRYLSTAQHLLRDVGTILTQAVIPAMRDIATVTFAVTRVFADLSDRLSVLTGNTNALRYAIDLYVAAIVIAQVATLAQTVQTGYLIAAQAVAAASGKAETLAIVGLYTAEWIGAAATGVLTAATWALGFAVAILTSPITLVVLAIAALTLGAIYAYNHFKPFHDLIVDTVDWVERLARGLGNVAVRMINDLNPFGDIPSFATGGVVPATPGGQLVHVAEGGRDEAIVPLPRRSVSASPFADGGMAGLRPVIVNFNGDINESNDPDRTMRHIRDGVLDALARQ